MFKTIIVACLTGALIGGGFPVLRAGVKVALPHITAHATQEVAKEVAKKAVVSTVKRTATRVVARQLGASEELVSLAGTFARPLGHIQGDIGEKIVEKHLLKEGWEMLETGSRGIDVIGVKRDGSGKIIDHIIAEVKTGGAHQIRTNGALQGSMEYNIRSLRKLAQTTGNSDYLHLVNRVEAGEGSSILAKVVISDNPEKSKIIQYALSNNGKKLAKTVVDKPEINDLIHNVSLVRDSRLAEIHSPGIDKGQIFKEILNSVE